MIVGAEKPPLTELAHHGVKGMKWGVRRALSMEVEKGTPEAQRIARVSKAQDAVARAKTDATYNRALDRLAVVQRQNKAEKALEKEKSRVDNEQARQDRRRLAAAGAIFVATMIASRGLAHLTVPSASSTPGLASTASKTPFAKERRGVHTITTMK